MAGIFVFSEDSALAKQLLTPALELKQQLSQPVTAVTSSEADAKELAAFGRDKVLVLQSASGWTEGLSEAICGLVSGGGASYFPGRGHAARQACRRLCGCKAERRDEH